MIKLLIPSEKGIFPIAAKEFSAYYQKITGAEIEILTAEDDRSSDLIVFGSDAENPFVLNEILSGRLPHLPIRTGTDDYSIISGSGGTRRFLFFAGGRPRALLYSIYDYFERFAGCAYFWDGDRIETRDTLPLSGIHVAESPHFQYRGTRYFAHRSLERFQAEHWDFPQWKQEIDWLLKKRFNLFMLRIGLDDLFQKAFPDLVDYPVWKVPETIEGSYDDRDLFWKLQYRAELRKKILDYAFERDLMHPEDVGTMTHWYSRTPKAFLEAVRPDFLPQSTAGYSDPTGRVWDIRQDGNLERYFHLTETHIRAYGKPELFHTIGLAERRCYQDPEANHAMKRYTLRRIIRRLRSSWPNAPLLIASWDFCMYWTPDEVRELLKELDPANTLIFDYTSDTTNDYNNFTNWGVLGKFPWIFGIFHAFESNADIRGDYATIARRLETAAGDPFCKGMVLWPENAHADTLMLEYVAANAWNPSLRRISDFLPEFCRKRYASEERGEMSGIWLRALPIIQMRFFIGPQTDHAALLGENIFRVIMYDMYSTLNYDNLKVHSWYRKTTEEAAKGIPEFFALLASRAEKPLSEFARRDLMDLAKMCCGRVLHCMMSRLPLFLEEWRNLKRGKDFLDGILEDMETFYRLTARLLEACEEFSLNHSLKRLENARECNPNFEKTLKANASNGYCRSYIFELFSALYLPEFKVYAKFIQEKTAAGDHTAFVRPDRFDTEQERIAEEFRKTPLRCYAPDTQAARQELPDTLKRLNLCSSRLLNAQSSAEKRTTTLF